MAAAGSTPAAAMEHPPMDPQQHYNPVHEAPDMDCRVCVKKNCGGAGHGKSCPINSRNRSMVTDYVDSCPTAVA